MRGLYRPIAEHLHKFCNGNDFVIYRDAFRWKRYYENNPHTQISEQYGDEVLSNHYDGMSLEQLAEAFECVETLLVLFVKIAVVLRQRPILGGKLTVCFNFML